MPGAGFGAAGYLGARCLRRAERVADSLVAWTPHRTTSTFRVWRTEVPPRASEPASVKEGDRGLGCASIAAASIHACIGTRRRLRTSVAVRSARVASGLWSDRAGLRPGSLWRSKRRRRNAAGRPVERSSGNDDKPLSTMEPYRSFHSSMPVCRSATPSSMRCLAIWSVFRTLAESP